MALFDFTRLYYNADTKISITSAIVKKGDSDNVPIGATGPVALTAIINGSVRVFNSDAVFWSDLVKGEKVDSQADWSANYATGDSATVIALEDTTAWYCIMDPTSTIVWTGNVHTLQIGEDVTVPQGHRVFLASSDGIADGTLQDRHTLINAQTKDVIVAANTDELICMEFWDSAI